MAFHFADLITLIGCIGTQFLTRETGQVVQGKIIIDILIIVIHYFKQMSG